MTPSNMQHSQLPPPAKTRANLVAAIIGTIVLAAATALAMLFLHAAQASSEIETQRLQTLLGAMAMFFLLPFWGLFRGKFCLSATLLLIAAVLAGLAYYTGMFGVNTWFGYVLSIPGASILFLIYKRNKVDGDPAVC